MLKELFKFLGYLLVAAVGVTIIVVVVNLIVYGTLPAFLNLQTSIFRNSRQYVETNLQQLSEMKSTYDRLETEIYELEKQPGNGNIIAGKRKQQDNLVREIRNTARMMNPGQVPGYIQDFLAEHSEIQ